MTTSDRCRFSTTRKIFYVFLFSVIKEKKQRRYQKLSDKYRHFRDGTGIFQLRRTSHLAFFFNKQIIIIGLWKFNDTYFNIVHVNSRKSSISSKTRSQSLNLCCTYYSIIRPYKITNNICTKISYCAWTINTLIYIYCILKPDACLQQTNKPKNTLLYWNERNLYCKTLQ